MWLTTRSKNSGQSSFQFIRLKPKRPGTALKRNLSLLINQVNPVGPAGVSRFVRVLKIVHQRGEPDQQFARAGSGHLTAFVGVGGAGEDHFVPDIAFHLPHIAGMGLGDVDNVELRLIFKLFGQLIESGNLPPEGRSGVTAENQDDRLVAAK